MHDPVAADGPSAAQVRSLHAVPSGLTTGGPDIGELAEELAAALRAVRGYVPNHIWWDVGASDALLAYQALFEG